MFYMKESLLTFFKYLPDDVCLENTVRFRSRNAFDIFSSFASVLANLYYYNKEKFN